MKQNRSNRQKEDDSMYIDLTTTVPQDSQQIRWAREQDDPHIAMGHIGTHLDTYEKSRIPLEYFKSKGILFDVRGLDEVTVDDIDLALVEENDFVLFRTGCMERHGYGEPQYFEDHPQLSCELIRKLLDKRIRFIGVDCPGIRQHEGHEKADRLCEQNGVYVIENLRSLENIPSQRSCIYTMWLDDEVMTGLKCRVIAEC